MTAMKPVLELVLHANVVFFVAFGIWWLTQALITRTRLKPDYALQLRLLRIVLLAVILSPALSFLAVALSQTIWPRTPITLSDLAVAAYLRGDIAMPAVQFEHLLDTRDRVMDMALAGELPWLTTLFALLCVGALYFVGRTAVSVSQLRKVLKGSHIWRRTRTTDIRFSDTVAIPFAARGVFRRHVVLPSCLLVRPDELRIVLAHELEHIRQGDVEWELAFELLRPFLYWNPVYLLWKRSFDRLRELNCDQVVVNSLRLSPRAYAECLLSFTKRAKVPRRMEVFNVAFVRTTSGSAKQALEARVMALQNTTQMQPRPVALFLMTIALSLVIVLTAASVRSPGDWSQDRLVFSMIVNLERHYASNSGF